MNNFNAGDRVVCVKAGTYEGRLQFGSEYTVKSIRNGYLRLEGVDGGWGQFRFIPASPLNREFQPGDTVRRINHDNCEDMTVGSKWVVLRQEGRWLSLEDYSGQGLVDNFVLIRPAAPAAPKDQPIKSLRLDEKAILKVLTTYVRDELKIDAEVSDVRNPKTGVIELAFKATDA